MRKGADSIHPRKASSMPVARSQSLRLKSLFLRHPVVTILRPGAPALHGFVQVGAKFAQLPNTPTLP
jgi:hypothetical protein